METAILEARNLQKDYKLSKDNTNRVIPGLNLEIRKGEFVVIMGNSGSGKSTLLYLLGGLDEASGGEVFVNGRLLPSGQKENALLRRSSMGVVFQQNNLVPSLTLFENILVAAFLVQKNRKAARQKALHLMESLEIGSLRNRYPSQVSGGEQQRCSIARALVNSPDILLADEPTGSLNSSSTGKVLQTFSELHVNGQTIVMVTHEVEAACYAERVVYLRDGEIVDEYRVAGDTEKLEKEKALLAWLTKKGW